MAKKIKIQLDAEKLKRKLNLRDGLDGKDYVLTEKDKKEIAGKVKVPVVDKIIEKTIIEQPIITNEIKEVAVSDDRKKIVEKINSGAPKDLKISSAQIEGIDKFISKENLDRSIGILDQRTQFLINKSDKWLADKPNYSTTAEADLLYKPIGYAPDLTGYWKGEVSDTGNFLTTGTLGAGAITGTSLGIGINAANATNIFNVSGETSNDVGSFDIGIDLRPVSAPAKPTLLLINLAGNVNDGTHYYAAAYVTDLGETNLSEYVGNSVVTDATHGQVDVTVQASTDYRVTSIKLYRTKIAGGVEYRYLLTTIPTNTTTTYRDNVADSGLSSTYYTYQINSTNSMITVNGVRAMVLDNYDTTFGLRAGASVTTGIVTAFGSNAAEYLTSGVAVTAIGLRAAIYNTTAYFTTAVGSGALAANPLTGWSNTAVGYSAASGVTSGQYNTSIGSTTGPRAVGSISNSINIGSSAGWYETGTAKLFIDSFNRSNEAASRAGAIIYGVMNATPASQHLTFNVADVTIPSTGKQIFNAATEYINSANAGYLDLNANTGIRLNIAVTLSGITSIGGIAPVADGTYNTGVGPLGNMGTITTKGGLITAVTQAT